MKWLLAAAAVFVLTGGVARACSVSGTVRCDATGGGVAGAVLRIAGPNGYADERTTTDGTYTSWPNAPGT